MPICAPCRVPHEPEDCEDTQQDRHGLARACYCQHKTQAVVTAEVSPGPECATPEGNDPHTVGALLHTAEAEEGTPR